MLATSVVVVCKMASFACKALSVLDQSVQAAGFGVTCVPVSNQSQRQNLASPVCSCPISPSGRIWRHPCARVQSVPAAGFGVIRVPVSNQSLRQLRCDTCARHARGTSFQPRRPTLRIMINTLNVGSRKHTAIKRGLCFTAVARRQTRIARSLP